MVYELKNGDCLEVMGGMDAGSIDTVITDPPYGLSFMGKGWGYGVPGVAFWEAALRVAKPGATLLAFGGTRTHHRLMVAIEDAGWEIRDVVMYLYGSGFPKSHQFNKSMNGSAAQWQGWGTALKPSWEPVVLAMKPLDGTFAQNAARHGVAGLNIDGARIGTADGHGGGKKGTSGFANGYAHDGFVPSPSGRWPANLILDEEAAEGQEWARYFYTAKASRREREEGLEGMDKRNGGTFDGNADTMNARKIGARPDVPVAPMTNHHPTVKPLSLMRYLVRLTSTPTGGVVLDPFMGSGTTGIASLKEGRGFVGIELDAEYFAIAQKRIAHADGQVGLFGQGR